jgi:hypothetical protein
MLGAPLSLQYANSVAPDDVEFGVLANPNECPPLEPLRHANGRERLLIGVDRKCLSGAQNCAF